MKTEGVKVEIREGAKLIAECSKCSLSMVDGKMINTLLNLGGAYCTMCAKSQSECEDKDVIQAGFVIERDLQTMKDIANALTEPDTGVITRKKGDYSTRQGICGAPLTDSDLTKNIPSCHSKIRVFSWTFDLLVRELSHKKWPTPSNGVRYTKEVE